MPGKEELSPVSHFGRQVRKERLARGWSLEEMTGRTGVAAPHWSRIENGKRPPTEKIAELCDGVFPERKGWFTEYYQESRTWMPPGLRSWTEHEDRASRLYVWSPGIIHGLIQTPGYARTFIAALPGVPQQAVDARLASRLERQRRVLFRKADPPTVVCIVDHAALYRYVGSADIMAEQMHYLSELAAMPNVTLQVLPAVAHPATASELIIADNSAAYVEHLVAGGVYTELEVIATVERLFNAIRAECYRATESVSVIGKAETSWIGVSQVSAVQTDHA